MTDILAEIRVMASNEVNELLITKEELIKFLPPDVLKTTLASLKVITEVTVVINVWKGAFIQYEQLGETRRWIFEQSWEVNEFIKKFVEEWKDNYPYTSSIPLQFTSSYSKCLHYDEYSYEANEPHPKLGITQKLIIKVQRHIVRR